MICLFQNLMDEEIVFSLRCDRKPLIFDYLIRYYNYSVFVITCFLNMVI
ncbi:MAG: hypothetical protein JETT_3899 [Candidatus Jettenia ecosi]|uniref:Uncharacterized protein n=1 Tax=Candidatus Jettenia ecosi TaxID=2494326 RepID=A0A533Q6U7_9BACT|nr:MAG: hypothetical protein JETT_3899 [Candidatus Jettenia ecosi]